METQISTLIVLRCHKTLFGQVKLTKVENDPASCLPRQSLHQA